MTDGVQAAQDWLAAQDWVTIWQSEWAAMAADRELHEAGQRLADLWAGAALALIAADAPGPPRPAPPTRPAPAAAAPDASGGNSDDGRDAAIAALQARIEQLERQLAGTAPGA